MTNDKWGGVIAQIVAHLHVLDLVVAQTVAQDLNKNVNPSEELRLFAEEVHSSIDAGGDPDDLSIVRMLEMSRSVIDELMRAIAVRLEG